MALLNIADAAKRGNSQAVINAIESGAPVDLQQLLRKVMQDFRTIRKSPGHDELAEYLLNAGAKPQREMAYEAARGGHARLIEVLLKHGLKQDLFVAAALGDAEQVKQLLSEDSAAVTECDSQRMTPLHYGCASSVWRVSPALQQSHPAVTLLLLEAGAAFDAPAAYYGLDGVTPLFCVAWTGGNEEIARQLLARGAQITPNILLAAVGHFQRHGDGNYAIAEQLLDHGFDVNAGEDRTALHVFAAHEDARGVAWLLAHGANVEACDVAGNTPLIAAARRNAGTRVIQQLLDAGADDTATNEQGETALAAAQAAGKRKTAELLKAIATDQ
ncbi:ankyrin repeat domain-containing protein [Blastopirellula marina]|uniref:Uncharacterized protein n=1 Tax=Blastopirellula marina TaxID=124 RepID=A0A2S8GTA2_9BACT|nr:ankyrin repeat domain-containing protein [Blastopirellula marina]PQO47642.1 hypothetical protein C5Y93_03010 [Blastopirellula marina]